MRRWSLLGLCAVATLAARADSVDLLIVAPDDAVLQPLVAALDAGRVETHAAWTFWCGTLAGKSVVLARGEGDPLNAVAATAVAIRHHAPRLILTGSPARAHDPALRAGDVVVSERFAAFDGMESPRREPGDGSDSLRWEKLPHLLMTPGERETPADSFPADPRAERLALGLPLGRGRVVAGVLGSANQVNREADRIAWLRANWHTSTEDGESAHIAGCAALLKVPVVGLCVVDGTDAEVAACLRRFVEAWR